MITIDSFKGKVVAITGAGAGMGKEAAVLYAKNGADVVVNSVTESAAQTAKECEAAGGRAVFVQGDVSDEAVSKKIIDTAIETFGKIDVLVTAAGVVRPGSVDQLEEEVVDEVLGVDVKGVIFTSKYAVRFMKEHGGGSICHVASAACLYGVKNRSIYTAAKGAVVALTKAMAMDHAAYNIRVNALCPGATLSPSMNQRFADSEDPEGMRAGFIANHPIGRLCEPIEQAYGILYMTSDEASFMTGQNLILDGGVSL